ncbi:TatD family hydrolase [Fusibacter paucivorans]|uniref:TatD family hydrolase n=1 Tax=Fusibacter paucivorans TaxID=76009 RepID=A0ABS5PQ49_9FIRM|nr:TatD family hydrolase [Fusibacter paucivorans]MBS7527171.1 TatD family hydrolase [Fusibacter paucivorans]
MLFDSHAHVDSSQFDHDRALVIKRAGLNDITYIMNPGADLKSSYEAVKLAEQYDFIHAAVGIHPHDVVDMDDMMLKMIANLAKKPVVKAIGEIGLDYYRDLSPRDLQQKWFIEQLALAKSMQLPVIIHDRDANDDVLRILKTQKQFETGVLMHCYSGSRELARQYVELGAYLSIAGPVTYKNARKLIEVAEYVPLDRLMIETDSPYLTPEPYRGKRNEPMNVRYTCERIAQIKGISFEALAEITLNNAKTYFKIT